MKIKIFIVLFFAAILLTAGCSIGGRWEKYSSADGRFSVHMPGEPIGNKVIIDTDFGRTYLYIYMLNKKDDDFAYSVSYFDYPLGVLQEKTIDRALDDARDGAVANIGGVLVNESKISMGKYPGREITVDVANGVAFVKIKLFLANKRLYQATVTTSKEKSTSNNLRRFLKSFEILEEQALRR